MISSFCLNTFPDRFDGQKRLRTQVIIRFFIVPLAEMPSSSQKYRLSLAAMISVFPFCRDEGVSSQFR
jgi:hypothetical protein